ARLEVGCIEPAGAELLSSRDFPAHKQVVLVLDVGPGLTAVPHHGGGGGDEAFARIATDLQLSRYAHAAAPPARAHARYVRCAGHGDVSLWGRRYKVRAARLAWRGQWRKEQRGFPCLGVQVIRKSNLRQDFALLRQRLKRRRFRVGRPSGEHLAPPCTNG